MNFLVSKKLKVKKYITFSSVIILLVATLYALIVGWGWYGFGSDYYFAYIQGMEWNNPNAKPFDFLGFKVATLVINEFYIGVYIVTFIMTLSTGFLIRECIKFKQSYSLIFFFINLSYCYSHMAYNYVYKQCNETRFDHVFHVFDFNF